MQRTMWVSAVATLLAPGLLTALPVDCLSPGRKTPAAPVPECVDSDGFAVSCAVPGSIRLWPNDFRPADGPFLPLNRDSTDRQGFTLPGSESGHEIFSGVDVVTVSGVSRRLYVSYNAGLQVWGIESDPGNPVRLDFADGWESDLLSFPNSGEVFFFIGDIAALSADSTTDVAAVAGKTPVGTSLWEFSTITQQLSQLYQDTGTDARQVRMVEMNNGVVYAFAGATDGLAVYDVRAAQTLGTPCLDDQGSSCPTVFRGLVGAGGTLFVDTLHVAGSDQVFVTTSGGLFVDLQLWQLSDPQNPATAVQRFSGLTHALGTALFTYNGHHYLAVISEENGLNQELLRIFMIDGCVNGSGTCSIGPGSMEEAVIPISLQGFPTAEDYLSYSEFDGDPYLYYGVGTGNLSGPDLERLFDLSALRPPNGSPLPALPEITQTGQHYTDPCNGSQIGYWSHSYHANAHGLNNVVPRTGKFSTAGYFYRAASSILDVHVQGNAPPPLASGIETVAAPQNEYWMSDVIAYQAIPTGTCIPSPLSWSWTAASSVNDVVPAQVFQGTDQAFYQFACLAPSGRCPDALAIVTAGNGACPDAILTSSTLVVKDPAIEVVSTDTGGRDTFERCETIPFSAELAGRGPAFWEWRLGGTAIAGCSADFPGGDLSGATVTCSLDGSQVATDLIFVDGFESGDTTRWSSAVPASTRASTAGLPVTVDLFVWDSPDTTLNPRATAQVGFTLTESGTPAFGSPSVVVDGSGATLTYPATDTTTWSWELEDPAGGDTCSFPGKPAVDCVRVTTSTSSIQHAWLSPGTYSYRVTASNCGPDTDSATGEVTVGGGIQPDVTFFFFLDGSTPAGCCGNPLVGYTCSADIALDFQVDMAEDGIFAFAFDWERTSQATASFTSQTPTGHPTTTRWIFSHTFSSPGLVFPIARAASGALSDTQGFITAPIEIVGGPCN